MAPQDDLTAERAAIYKYHKVFDGYNFLSGPKGMEEIVGHDMELISLEDHIDALTTARQEALRDVLSDLDSLHWKDHWYADQLRRKINERLL